MIPEESKKTFSRHFKYLIKRAVQLNVKGIERETLPKDEEDIYEVCFKDDRWKSWEEMVNEKSKQDKLGLMNQSLNFSYLYERNYVKIPLKSQLKYTYLLDVYCKGQQPFYLLGKSSSGKNSLMMEFISSLSQETYNSLVLACMPKSTHRSAKM